jgi:DNA-binding PadR family transcriptional regulator
MDDQRRIYYQITGAGVEALAAELERYEHLVNLARARNLSPQASAYGL